MVVWSCSFVVLSSWSSSATRGLVFLEGGDPSPVFSPLGTARFPLTSLRFLMEGAASGPAARMGAAAVRDGKGAAGRSSAPLARKIFHFLSTAENMSAWSPMVSEDPR